MVSYLCTFITISLIFGNVFVEACLNANMAPIGRVIIGGSGPYVACTVGEVTFCRLKECQDGEVPHPGNPFSTLTECKAVTETANGEQ